MVRFVREQDEGLPPLEEAEHVETGVERVLKAIAKAFAIATAIGVFLAPLIRNADSMRKQRCLEQFDKIRKQLDKIETRAQEVEEMLLFMQQEFPRAGSQFARVIKNFRRGKNRIIDRARQEIDESRRRVKNASDRQVAGDGPDSCKRNVEEAANALRSAVEAMDELAKDAANTGESIRIHRPTENPRGGKGRVRRRTRRILAIALAGRLAGAVRLPVARAWAKAGAASLVAMFSGMIDERAAQGQTPEQIADEIINSSEFDGFVQPLEGLSSICQEFQPELGNMVERLNQPGPTRDVDTCPLANQIANRIMGAIEEAQVSPAFDPLPLPDGSVSAVLSGCQADVQQVMEACDEV